MQSTPPLNTDRRSPRTGFLLPLEMIYAPRRAFATVAAAPEWIPAYVLTALFGVVGIVLAAPALLHAITNEMVALHRATPGEALQAGAEVITRYVIDQLVVPLESWAFAALVFTLVFPAEMKPLRAFAVYFAVAANVGVIDAISTLVFGAVVRAHDPNSFGSLSEMILAVPDSLASFRPDGAPREIVALGNWDVFAFWSQILLGYALAAVSGARLTYALLLSFGVGLAVWIVTNFLG